MSALLKVLVTFLTVLIASILFVLIRVVNSVEAIQEQIHEMKEDINTLGKMIKTEYRIPYDHNDLNCLTRNIYYEAGNQDDTGKYAVAHVTINRLQQGFWGNKICKVVYSPQQFSWTLLRKLPKPDPELWERCKQIAIDTFEGARIDGLERSLFYHADYIPSPKWADVNHYALTIGNHIFYNRAKNSWVSL